MPKSPQTSPRRFTLAESETTRLDYAVNNVMSQFCGQYYEIEGVLKKFIAEHPKCGNSHDAGQSMSVQELQRAVKVLRELDVRLEDLETWLDDQ